MEILKNRNKLISLVIAEYVVGGILIDFLLVRKAFYYFYLRRHH